MAKAITQQQQEYFDLCRAEKTLEHEGLMDDKLKKSIDDKKKEKLPKTENVNAKGKK